MKHIFNAVYVAIFLKFIEALITKIRVPVEHDLKVEHRDQSDNWYICCGGHYLVWEESKEDAQVFCWNAIARCKSLSIWLSIVETGDEYGLVAAEEIPGLTQDEIDALNIEIDSSMD